MQLQDYIFYCYSNYLNNYKEIKRAQRARNALVVTKTEQSPAKKKRMPYDMTYACWLKCAKQYYFSFVLN